MILISISICFFQGYPSAPDVTSIDREENSVLDNPFNNESTNDFEMKDQAQSPNLGGLDEENLSQPINHEDRADLREACQSSTEAVTAASTVSTSEK